MSFQISTLDPQLCLLGRPVLEGRCGTMRIFNRPSGMDAPSQILSRMN